MDVSKALPFNRVICPKCKAEIRVKVDFGAYLLERRLAFGGMSVLYIARDQTLGRVVALKVLNESYSQDEVRMEQFEREAELTALVSHPNVVQVYSVGRAFGRFYIAMELINGESLEDMLEREKTLPERQVLEIARQVVKGLRAAQQAGLIHRDIKPGNILVDEEERVKIVDFGLSLVTQAGAARSKEIFATAYYAPPEALEGGEEDFRSDIYALGASLYHVLAGMAPITNRTRHTKALLDKKRNVPPLNLNAPKVSEETVALISRSMSYQREQRFSSYDELLLALDSAILTLKESGGTEKIVASPTQDKEVKRTSKKMLGALVAASLAFCVSGYFLIQELIRDPIGLSSSSAEFIEARPQRLEAELVSQMISERYEKAQADVLKGDFQQAELAFLRLWRKQEVPESTASWSGFEAGLAALLDGRAGDAKLVFERLHQHLHTRSVEREIDVLLEGLLKDWGRVEGFVLSSECPAEVELALVEFARALKNWEQGDRDALSYFEVFGNHEFAEQGDWVANYQEWARKLVQDGKLLERAAPNLKKPYSKAERLSELTRLTEVLDQLQTKGRARLTVEDWKERIEEEASDSGARKAVEK